MTQTPIGYGTQWGRDLLHIVRYDQEGPGGIHVTTICGGMRTYVMVAGRGADQGDIDARRARFIEKHSTGKPDLLVGLAWSDPTMGCPRCKSKYLKARPISRVTEAEQREREKCASCVLPYCVRNQACERTSRVAPEGIEE